MGDAPAHAAGITAHDVRTILADPSRLTLVAQPIVDLRHCMVVGYEALSRFTLQGPARPDFVFAAATEAGLDVELEMLVLRRALELSKHRPNNCFLTVNIDPTHLESDAVWSLIESHGDLSGVVFELTEHRSIEDLSKLAKSLERLRKHGAMTALDDAGSGYSGLKQILELRPQFIKVDRDLMTQLHVNEAKRALVQMLGDLAGRLDAWLIAEGIENDAELRALGQLGVPLGQGYFLGRPAPPWTGLEARAREELLAHPQPAQAIETLDSLVEPCARCGEGSDWRDVDVCVRVAGESRPIAMRLFGEGGEERVRSSLELLRVKRGSSIHEIGLRAATRPERLRWDPLVCIDDRGNFEGIVPMQRLVSALATRPDR